MSVTPHKFSVERNVDKAKIAISETQTAFNKKGRVNHEDEDADQIEKKEDETGEAAATVSHRGSDEDDGGFKTPTSSDHRIPPIKQCPPAPMKPRPPPLRLKRKAPSSSQPPEIESIFRSIANDQDDAQQHKIKQARTDEINTDQKINVKEKN
ncbi:hypothetical protein AAHA92_17604 [Salvia divinorum]|uniref:Uncharacterized protein n=1 Tax=Salvia divinorum TaxID=28513 RepID=A0ABD1H3B4_SALDI